MPRYTYNNIIRGGSRTAATSKMERFVIIVNGFQPLTSMTKRSILHVSTGLDPPLIIIFVTNVIRLEFLSASYRFIFFLTEVRT